MEFVETLIKSIVDNKNMPKVQVEREISPILEIFIEDIMNGISRQDDNNIDKGKYRFIAPEFPLQSQKKEKGKLTNRSTNVDYLLINENTCDLYFVELKTDSNSFKHEQFFIYDDIIDKESDISKTPQLLFNFLKDELVTIKYKNLKKFIDYRMGNESWSGNKPKLPALNWLTLKNIKLVYIAPEKMLEKAWKGKNEEAIDKLKKNHSVINFKKLKSIKVSNYENEWDIITDKLSELDKN